MRVLDSVRSCLIVMNVVRRVRVEQMDIQAVVRSMMMRVST
jgi:hypothetical protein